MKKVFAVVLLIACGMFAFAQEKKMSAGLGLEWNMDSRHNFAGGTLLTFDYKLQRFVSLGILVAGSSNFSDTHVIEPAFAFRAYYREYEFSGPFFQSELGISFIYEAGDRWVLPLVGAGAGYRFLLGQSFYIEPYGRLGYPFAFGFGLIGGMRF